MNRSFIVVSANHALYIRKLARSSPKTPKPLFCVSMPQMNILSVSKASITLKLTQDTETTIANSCQSVLHVWQ